MKKLRTTDKKIRRKRIIRLIFYGVVFVCLMRMTYCFYHLLANSLWDGKNRFNFVLRGESILIASFDPTNDSLAVLFIPKRTFIETIYGYGPYRVESIYQLGELEGRGGELLSGSLQEYLGLPVDGYISIDNLAFPIDDSPEKLRDFLTVAMKQLLRGVGQTDFTRWDLFRLWWLVKRTAVDDLILVNLGETSASSEIELPDGTQATKIDTDRLEKVVNQLFVDKHLRSENLAVVVLNGTTHRGLAHRGARIIGNIGGRIVGLGEKTISIESCEVRSMKSHRNSYTTRKIEAIFDCQWAGENLEDQRAEVVLILGEDYWQKITGFTGR